MQSSLDKQRAAAAPVDFTPLPVLPRAWRSSAAWALGSIGSCGLLGWWASQHNAFEFGDQGQEHLIFLTVAVLPAATLFHKCAYKVFQQVYLARGASQHAGRLGLAWLVLLSLLRAGWVLALLLLVLLLLVKGSNTNAGWQ